MEIAYRIILPLAFCVMAFIALHFQRLYKKYKGMCEIYKVKETQYEKEFHDMIVRGFMVKDNGVNITDEFIKNNFTTKN